MDVVETRAVGRFTVNVSPDQQYELSDAVNDEPVMIFCRDNLCFIVMNQTKHNFPDTDFLCAYHTGDTAVCLDTLCDMWASEWEWNNGKLRAEHADWSRSRYFKTEKSALAALFQAEHGRALSDLRVEHFGDRRDSFYLCFWQSELDEYAGVKGAQSCHTSCQHIVDGDVYGFDVVDAAGETVDSCWGFIGDSVGCLLEGVSLAEYYEARAKEEDALALAVDIAASRPDLCLAE
tara:strand:+ start:2582 stop:3283 length:702 start_codon:yes stop_codon:yes gene_type:complete